MSRSRLLALAVSAAALATMACDSADSSPVAASTPPPASQATPAPLPAPTQQSRPPRITSMRFDTLHLPTAEDCPLPGELALVACGALDDDADIVSMEIRLEALETASFSPGYPTTVTQRFEVAATTRRSIEALFMMRTIAAPLRSVRATCEVYDSLGLKDSRTRFCGWQ